MQQLERGITEAIWTPLHAVTMRVAARDDAHGIAAFWCAARGGRVSRLKDEDVLDAVYGRMSEPESLFLLAYDGERLVGMVHASIVTRGIGPRRTRYRRMRLCMLAVDPTYWRGGVRRDLLSWCLAYARANRVDTVALWTRTEAAPKLMERLGFHFDHRWKLDIEGDVCARYRYDVGRR